MRRWKEFCTSNAIAKTTRNVGLRLRHVLDPFKNPTSAADSLARYTVSVLWGFLGIAVTSSRPGARYIGAASGAGRVCAPYLCVLRSRLQAQYKSFAGRSRESPVGS